MSRDEIFASLSGYLSELFDIPPAQITIDATLFDELGLDSIDAVDLVVKLQELTGRKISPAEFKSVRTVGDIVENVHAHFVG